MKKTTRFYVKLGLLLLGLSIILQNCKKEEVLLHKTEEVKQTQKEQRNRISYADFTSSSTYAFFNDKLKISNYTHFNKDVKARKR